MIKFDINGNTIEFDENMNNYNSIRKLFKNNAKLYSKEFTTYCENHIYNLKELTDYAVVYGEEYIEDAIVKGVETIVSFKVITIDVETFKEKYCRKYLNFQRLLSNIIKNTSTSKNKKNHYLTQESLKPLIKEISDNLYKDYFNIHLAVVDALLEQNIENVSTPLSEENIRISNALINNYKDGFINDLEQSDVVNKIISLNPYRMDLYEFLVYEDGDFNKEIEKLVDFIGEDIKPYKDLLIGNYIDKCTENDSNSELVKERISKYCKYIGVENEDVYLARIEGIYMFANA